MLRCSRPCPIPSPINWSWSGQRFREIRNGIAAQDFEDWKHQSNVFSDMNAFTGGSFNLATKEQPEYLQGQFTSPGMYRMMGVKFLLGRDFLPDEGIVGKEHVVILINKLWKRLGSDPNIIGKQSQSTACPTR